MGGVPGVVAAAAILACPRIFKIPMPRLRRVPLNCGPLPVRPSNNNVSECRTRGCRSQAPAPAIPAGRALARQQCATARQIRKLLEARADRGR